MSSTAGIPVVLQGGEEVNCQGPLMWNWSVLPDPIPQFRCEHMTASGLRLRSVACGVCGPLWRAPV